MRKSAHNSKIRTTLDRDNPHSLVSLIEGNAFAEAVERVPNELWELNETQLSEQVRPTRTDFALKVALWNEFRIASETRQTIKPSRIFAGICTQPHWSANVLGNPTKVAWLLSPICEYEKMIEPLLYCWVDRQAEILSLPLYDKQGRALPAVGKLIAQVGQRLEDRMLGSPIERQAVWKRSDRGAGYSHSASLEGDGMPENPVERMEWINKRLKELEVEEREALHLPPLPAQK